MNKKMISRLQELGLDPNKPISKHDLLQLEGNRNLNLSTAAQEENQGADAAEVVESKMPQPEEQVEKNVQERPDDKVDSKPEPKKLPVEAVKKEVPKKSKNALKELKPKTSKTGSVKKKKETS